MTILPQPPAIVAGAESSPAPVAFRSAVTVRMTPGQMAAREAAILLRLDALNVDMARAMEIVALNSAPPSPERIADLESLGYGFGLDRDDDAAPPEGSTAAEVAAFDRGWAAGRAEWDRRLDEMCASSDYAAAFSDYDAWPNGGMS